MSDLQGHNVVITGGTKGIGAAIAIQCARAGADLVLHGLQHDEDASKTSRQCEQLGAEVALVTEDLATDMPNCVDRLFHACLDRMPRANALISNAGTYGDLPFLQMDFARFHRTMQLNVYAGYFLIQRFARHWLEQGTAGKIVITGSINGRLAEPVHSAYDVSKGAVEMMVKTLCVELAPRGIRVNGLAPGLLNTPLTRDALSDRRLHRWMQIHTPNGQIPGPEAAAAAAVFLISDAAAHIHGHMLMVDGGMSAWQQPDPPPDFDSLST